jgi:tRNA nucleotidyltransferase/poly(A) polymerase
MSTATKTEEARPAGLEIYRVRDELAQSYNPANALERMLVTQMAQSWLRLQRAYEAEERYFQAHEVLDAIANDSEKYKAITRYVTDCERAWRHAMLHLEKAQRRRTQTGFSPNARRRPFPESTSAAPAKPVNAHPELPAGPAASPVAKTGRPESSSRAG